MREGIYHHGNVLNVAKAAARRYGWDARAEHVGVDPYDESAKIFGVPKEQPNRGDIIVFQGGGAQVAFEYELPEDPDLITATVRQLIEADRKERDRRADPDEYARPIAIGDSHGTDL